MQNVLSVYRSKLLAHGIVVDAEYNDLRKIRAHSGEIVQIFSNVISNAIDAMARGGKLSIAIAQSAKTERDGLKIVVNDTGHGISREHLGKVFEPFFTTKGNLGTGIGLWVTRQLVERHGGHISISSSTEPGNSGTIVMIDLPFDNSGDANSANTGQLGSSAEIR